MATYTFESKTKEIAVRKVLGAHLASIISVLTKDLLRPLIAALIVSVPVAFYATNRWLESFAYRAPVDPVLFVRAIGFMVIVVVVAISFHTIRAASANPVRMQKRKKNLLKKLQVVNHLCVIYPSRKTTSRSTN